MILLLTMGGYSNLPRSERDYIQFPSPITTVESKLLIVSDLLDKTVVPDSNIRNYFFDKDDNLYVNSVKLGVISAGLNHNLNIIFANFTKKEIGEFTGAILFLKKNHISSVFYEALSGRYLYDYRTENDPTFKTARYIYLDTQLKKT